jgi:hypothetical protein
MLDIGHERDLIDDFWALTELQARLPEPAEVFFALKGPVPMQFDSKRRFHRFFLRGKAILYRQDAVLGIYTKDVSRHGIGILSPIQLLPRERIQMRAVSAGRLQLEVTRCRRLGQGCYECGAKFVLSRDVSTKRRECQ